MDCCSCCYSALLCCHLLLDAVYGGAREQKSQNTKIATIFFILLFLLLLFSFSFFDYFPWHDFLISCYTFRLELPAFHSLCLSVCGFFSRYFGSSKIYKKKTRRPKWNIKQDTRNFKPTFESQFRICFPLISYSHGLKLI